MQNAITNVNFRPASDNYDYQSIFGKRDMNANNQSTFGIHDVTSICEHRHIDIENTETDIVIDF